MIKEVYVLEKPDKCIECEFLSIDDELKVVYQCKLIGNDFPYELVVTERSGDCPLRTLPAR